MPSRTKVETFQKISDDYAKWSNTICRIPYFTTSYKDAVESARAGQASLNASASALARDFLLADLAGAALAEFGGPSPLTHGQWVTKVVHITKPLSSAQVIAAINRLPTSSKALLSKIGKVLRFSAASSDELAMRFVIVENTLVKGGNAFLKLLDAKILFIPKSLEAALSHLSSAASQGLNILGFVSIWCTGANVLAAYFEALSATESARLSARDAQTWELDACARMNSHKKYFNGFCKGVGALSRFDTQGNTRCKQFTVSQKMRLSDNNKSPIGAKIYGDKWMSLGLFRVGPGVGLDLQDVFVLPKGYIVAKVKVVDSGSAYKGSVGWTYIGALEENCRQ